MTRRRLEDKNIRKIFKSGQSYCVTLPVEIIRQYRWKERQKVVAEKVRGGILIRDWRK